MKVCLIIYHKDLLEQYEYKWIDKCLRSLNEQTYQDFDIIELNYGTDDLDIVKKTKYFKNKKYLFVNKEFNKHTEAVNYLLELAFKKLKYDCVFNINIDDFYATSKIEEQLKYVNDYDIITSNFIIFQDGEQREIKNTIYNSTISKNDEQQYIKLNLKKNKNVIQNSGICITKKFYNKVGGYSNNIPYHDILLWKKAIKNKCSFHIINKNLTFYRIHPNQITNNYRQEII